MMRRTMCWILGSGLLLGTASTAATAPAVRSRVHHGSSEALDILKKSEAALTKVEQVSYQGKFKGTGWVAKRVPKVEGTAVVGSPSEWDIIRFVAEVKLTPRDSSETLEFSVGSDGDVYFLIDPKTKTAYEDMDPVVLGTHSRDLQRLVMREFVSPHPFGEKLKPETLELKGTETVGGVECYKILIKGDGTNSDPDRILLIARKDLLPRGIRRIYPPPRDSDGAPGTTELMVTDLKVNPTFKQNPFKLVVPPGFTKTDEFAP